MQLFSILSPSSETIRVIDCSPKSALIAAVAFSKKITNKAEHSKLETQIEGEEDDVLSLQGFMVQPSEAIEVADPVGVKGVEPSSAEFLELISYAGRHNDPRWPILQDNTLVRGLALCVCYDPSSPGVQYRRIVEIGNGKDNASLDDIKNGVVIFAPGIPMLPAMVWINPKFKPEAVAVAPQSEPPAPVVSLTPPAPAPLPPPSAPTADPLGEEEDDSFEDDDE